jgi:molecular chaperone GrpE
MSEKPTPDEEADPTVDDVEVQDLGTAEGAEAAAAEPSAFDEIVGDLEVDLDALLKEREQFLGAYQRVAADFDNFRKQAQKRLDDEVTRTLGGFVERLLPVLDTIEGAKSHGSDDVDAVASQLFGLLEKEGLEIVNPAGQAFDPNVAEAVMHEPGEGEPMVTEVFRIGYLFKGRVLRPAMVKVSG